MPPNDHVEGPETVGTWLVIPYFEGDTGVARPVPDTKAISYLCRCIVVDGEAGVFTLHRGVPMGVTVDVANFGGGALIPVAETTFRFFDMLSSHP